jgi:hypothetical protein
MFGVGEEVTEAVKGKMHLPGPPKVQFPSPGVIAKLWKVGRIRKSKKKGRTKKKQTRIQPTDIGTTKKYRWYF